MINPSLDGYSLVDAPSQQPMELDSTEPAATSNTTVSNNAAPTSNSTASTTTEATDSGTDTNFWFPRFRLSFLSVRFGEGAPHYPVNRVTTSLICPSLFMDLLLYSSTQ